MTITSSHLWEEDFETLLQKVLLDRDLMFELLGHSVFLNRGYLICCWFVRATNEDARELFADAYLKALLSRDRLRADNTPNGEAFFGWFTQLTFNLRIDQWRKRDRERNRLLSLTITDEESFSYADREIADLAVDLDGDLLLKEFMEFTKTLPVKYRHAIVLRLKNYPNKGCPYKKIAEQLNSMGIACTAPSVRSWVKASLKAFLNGGRVAHDGGQVAHKKRAVSG